MHTAPYLWMHVLTLICNLLLYISYSSVKGEHPVDSFRRLLLLFILCPASSICQRLFLWPGPLFWFKTSQMVLLLLPMTIYYFLLAYVGRKPAKKDNLRIWILTALLEIPSFYDMYLGRPVLQELENGQIGIFYEGDARLLVPVAIVGLFFYYCSKLMRENRHRREFLDLKLGILGLIVGNILLLVPGNTFPFDMLGCMFNCIMMAMALSRMKLLKLRISLPFETLVFMAALTTALSGILIFVFIDRSTYLGEHQGRAFELWIVSVTATLLIAYLYSFISRRTSLVNSDHLVDTSRSYSEAMMEDLNDSDQIVFNLKHVMAVLVGEVDSVIYLYDPKSESYKAVARDRGRTSCPDVLADSRLAGWLRKDQRVDRTSSMMWTLDHDVELLKVTIEDRKLTYVVPFISDGTLLGFMFFGIKNGRNLRESVLHAIDSIVLTTSMALQNMEIYRNLEDMLTEDPRTGLLLREAFDEQFDVLLHLDKKIILYIPDLDDMKLYNQVYGSQNGDAVMRRFGEILRKDCPKGAIISRYEGKTCCVAFEGTIENGIDLDKVVRKDWAECTRGTRDERVHFSSGLILVDRSRALDSLEAVTLGRLAVKKAKRQGKNQFCLFTPEMVDDRNLWETGFSINTAEAISRAIDLKDHFTYNHSENVARYARELAIEIGLSYYEQQLIYEAGLIHDVGKIAIPDRVLTKPGRLTDEEYELMKTHVECGHSIISASSHGHLLVPLAENHHERWDGRGYPKGIKGEDIPIGGRCLAIADAFDAMTGRRIYKNAMSIEDAVAELERCKGTQFDPELTDVFVRLIDEGRIRLSEDMPKTATV